MPQQIYEKPFIGTFCMSSEGRLLPNRSPVAWGSQRIALAALIFHSNTAFTSYVGLLSSQRLALRAPLKFS